MTNLTYVDDSFQQLLVVTSEGECLGDVKAAIAYLEGIDHRRGDQHLALLRAIQRAYDLGKAQGVEEGGREAYNNIRNERAAEAKAASVPVGLFPPSSGNTTVGDVPQETVGQMAQRLTSPAEVHSHVQQSMRDASTHRQYIEDITDISSQLPDLGAKYNRHLVLVSASKDGSHDDVVISDDVEALRGILRAIITKMNFLCPGACVPMPASQTQLWEWVKAYAKAQGLRPVMVMMWPSDPASSSTYTLTREDARQAIGALVSSATSLD